MMVWELLIILFLIVLNGFFAMAELAVVSARKIRLQLLADEGHRGAVAAIQLAKHPSRFLSTVQIGITLIGIFAGAYGGATLAQKLGAYLASFPLLAPIADGLALTLVVASITYLSLIAGELVPKQLALRSPERIAAWVAKPMAFLSMLAAPLAYVLDASTRLALRMLGETQLNQQAVTDEEIKGLIAEATAAGVVELTEQAMIGGVMRLADRPARVIMTPRPDVVWLDLDDSPEHVRATLRENGYSRFPVGRGDLDNVLGVVQAKDLLDCLIDGKSLDIEAALHERRWCMREANALQVLEILKQSPLHVALVVDEYGSLRGIVTATDILKAIVGALAAQGESAEPEIVQREDGSWLLDGGLAIDELKELLRIRELPGDDEFHTLAGIMLAQFGHVPTIGEHFSWGDYRFEVVDVDGRRVDRVLVSRVAADSAADDSG
ncbi:MAG: hemolysin family protein [Gammaproteobacteria bacterium]